jgi:5-hydroxyisourate hydrolase
MSALGVGVARMGKLTTHVLDTSLGKPASGVAIDLHRLASAPAEETRVLITSALTNSDGRAGTPLLEGAAMQVGRYSLTFHIAAYFRLQGIVLPDPPFLDRVVIPFGIAEADGHYHVPLLVSPWSFSTYRGS